MDVTFKTLAKQKFKIYVDSSDSVEDIIVKLGNIIGNENLYRLIYAGKLLKEGTPVSEYNISTKLPILVMVTKPTQQRADNASIEEMEILRRNKLKENKEKTAKSKIWAESEESDYILNEDEDISNQFIAEKEFKIAVDVVMSCESLFDEHKKPLTKPEIISYINYELDDLDDDESNLKEIIVEKIDILLKRNPNKKQISAFLVLQFFRYLFLQDPSQLQTMLKSFGQSHPDLMNLFNKNKKIFVSMLHDQTWAKNN